MGTTQVKAVLWWPWTRYLTRAGGEFFRLTPDGLSGSVQVSGSGFQEGKSCCVFLKPETRTLKPEA